MKGHVAAFALLSSIVGAVNVRDIHQEDPATWCITYLSTYIAPISFHSALPRPSANSSGSELVSTGITPDTTLPPSAADTLSSSATGSAPTSASFEPNGQRIILLITPSGGNTKRDVGGFVGDDNPDICTFATVFILGQGGLSQDGVPFAYLGNGYQKFDSSPALPIDPITTTFSSEGGVLKFANSALPNSQASFCQTSSDGQVYITFTSKPSGCVPVALNVYAAERCVNGRLDGVDATTTGPQSFVSSVSDNIQTEETSMPDNTSAHQTEMSTDDDIIVPTSVGSLSDATETPQETSDEPTSFPTFFGTGSLTGDPEDIDRPTDIVSDSPTATQPGPGGAITNAVANGRFAKSSNSGSGLVDWSEEGSAKQQKSDCYKADGSSDDGCVALGSSSVPTDIRKRAFNGLGSIIQMLSNLDPSTTTRYTVQFYYVVITVGQQSCSINAYLGNRQFYTMGLFSSGGVSGSWNRVLTTVIADSRSANLGISMTCSGNGLALLYVDSVFVSNQVTPENIDQYELDFGDGDDTPDTPTERLTSRPPSIPTRRPIDPGTSDPGEDISTSIEKPTSDDWKPTTRHVPRNTTDWMPHPETSTGSMENTPVSKPTILPPREETSVDLEPTFTDESTTDWPEQTSDGFSLTSDMSLEATEAPSSTTQETTATSETTTTSEEPSPTCQYRHGEMCNFDRFNYPKDVLCSWEGIYNGELWTESRTDYPVQGRLEHCIAICQGMSNCKSAGYNMITNRCYFSGNTLIKDDFTPEDDGWKTTAWLDKRCYTDCETCKDSDPKADVTDCAYTHDDTCQRVSTPDGKICNYSAWIAGMFVTGDQMIGQFPESDQTSPEKCAAICRGFYWCKASGYKDGRCKWMGFSLSLTGDLKLDTDRDPSWFSVWDDVGCFDCPGCH
ncbi:uncharacterized protein B0J16DRAFT_416555 [Fusarium flagelliforme]|uniref:uncharacterized protein n=1 Tax=Fusarium flagelliforme TaxID=2675880 RepID=UPI001E8E5EE9|nr:uncharacterized protein B0J16DRAFT_416555 [Fusarium flagelliforme]KAH7183503.1 hypothetical protein B0J16DRAFT_416555 [Fusarium flagelliforme]